MTSSVIRQRDDLRLLVGTEVEVSGRVKEFRRHPKRRELDTVLLVNLIVTPSPFGESIALHHLWFLKKQFCKIGAVPRRGERVWFKGIIYAYTRLGGKSRDRGLLGAEDYGIRPLGYYEN